MCFRTGRTLIFRKFRAKSFRTFRSQITWSYRYRFDVIWHDFEWVLISLWCSNVCLGGLRGLALAGFHLLGSVREVILTFGIQPAVLELGLKSYIIQNVDVLPCRCLLPYASNIRSWRVSTWASIRPLDSNDNVWLRFPTCLLYSMCWINTVRWLSNSVKQQQT